MTDDLKIQLRVLIESLSHDKLKKVYDYTKSLKDGPPGNLCQCNHPIKVCKCEGRE